MLLPGSSASSFAAFRIRSRVRVIIRSTTRVLDSIEKQFIIPINYLDLSRTYGTTIISFRKQQILLHKTHESGSSTPFLTREVNNELEHEWEQIIMFSKRAGHLGLYIRIQRVSKPQREVVSKRLKQLPGLGHPGRRSPDRAILGPHVRPWPRPTTPQPQTRQLPNHSTV